MIHEKLTSILRDSDVLLIVPPFAGLDRPSLGAHVLQACASQAGYDVFVFYANIYLAREVGELNFESICYAPSSDLSGERFFARAAYGIDAYSLEIGAITDTFEYKRASKNINLPIDLKELHRLSGHAEEWADALTEAICSHKFLAIGCTTTFEQTAASVALLNRIKEKRPDILTIIGGANCEGEMANGIQSLGAKIDFIFSGECEDAFPQFLNLIKEGKTPSSSVICGNPCQDMDSIPTPDFSDYYEQLNSFLPNSVLSQAANIWLPYESSRGCWWGQKFHCTFCGINGQGMKFREKSSDRVINELKTLLQKHPTNKVCMVDNIMPHHYFQTVLPRLAEEIPNLHIFYEQKSNLSLQRVRLLKEAGVAVIQPGIEALSTPLLKLMDKGVSAAQNIALLRYARTLDLSVNWNILYAFPDDKLQWYQSTLNLIPLLAHLHPPTGVFHLSIDRFSPYFDKAHDYGVSNIRPIEAYFDVLPPYASASQIAYHFEANYISDSRLHSQIIDEIQDQVSVWRSKWETEGAPLPMLSITPLNDDLFLIVDTRSIEGNKEFQLINRTQAMLALLGNTNPSGDSDEKWALDSSVCVEIDNKLVPLATTEPELLERIETPSYKTYRQIERHLPVITAV